MKKLTFKKVIHPKEFKELTEHLEVQTAPIPPKVVIPVNQHIGAPLKPLVEKGDRVKTGQPIANVPAFVAAPVHASVTGTVKSIGKFATSVLPGDTCIEIETEETDEYYFNPEETHDYQDLEKEQIVELIREAGIVGMGGAAFPASVKFTPPPDITIDTIILNGCECEPYLTSDHRVMLEQSERVIEGLKITMKATGARRGVIGIENNKPDAIAKLTQLVEDEPYINVQAVKTKYPQGAEKMLIDALTGRKVPAGGLPFQIGVVVSNVGTATAVYDAVVRKKPLYERVVTFSGDAVKSPANLLVRIGTPLSFLFDHLGGFSSEPKKILVGGPMMGVAQFSIDIGVSKACSGVLAISKHETPKEYNCINCCRCVYHCPMFLVPTKIVRFAKHNIWDKTKEFGAHNCIECGSCSFECPSKIPLVQWIRVAKRRLIEIEKSTGS